MGTINRKGKGMNREIKFRLWEKNNKEMIVGNSLFTIIETYAETALKDQSMPPLGFIKSYYEIMQFTGLKDKNGKEIYEGDIVRIYRLPPPSYLTHFLFHRFLPPVKIYIDASAVSWYRGKFVIKHELFGKEALGAWNDNLVEVIGNIYENKELL